ncbi:MAG: hypothetical protein H7199_08430 [Burkholderiales bacterium]|nr:hypothetical protein [Flavobacterium sp.]
MKKTLLILLLVHLNSSASIIYVNSSATGLNNGLSWNNAYINLQEALSNAIFGDEIWVAAGTYKTTTTTTRTISFVSKNGVNLYGSFSGNETSINQRNIATNPTTLSGDIGVLGDNLDNTYTILKVENITSGLTIDGFRIISGNNDTGSGCPGIRLQNNTGIINIKNCFFFNNFGIAGSAISVLSQGNFTVNVSDSDFNGNSGIDGTIFGSNASSNNLNINNCRFRGAVTGGTAVLRFQSENLNMSNCIITNNTSTQSNIISITADSSAKISNCLIVGNSYNESAIGFYSLTSANQIAENLTVAHNKKDFTGSTNTFYTAIYSVNGTAKIYNSIIYDNTNSSNNTQINNGNQAVGNIVSNSIVQNGFANGTNILNVNPNFINPNNLISAPFDSTNFNYRLQNTSQGINYGDNNFVTTTQDIDGNSRIQQTTVDTGAYENFSTLSLNENLFSNTNLMYNNNNDMLSLKNIEVGKIDIFDITGKLVGSREIRGQICLSDLKIGIYIIILRNKNEKIKICKK